ncbi:hypothetical protein AGRO_0445 [Agrobacterium sp. ATCC 31749]|nr:hypothetical protein AGRO_0445 [Agrobacterium sp. ATCC 31749]
MENSLNVACGLVTEGPAPLEGFGHLI